MTSIHVVETLFRSTIEDSADSGRHSLRRSLIGSLSKGVFERRTSTGNEIFFILKWIDKYQICISSSLKSQISNLYFNTVKSHQVFCYIWSINYITIFNNNKYKSKESLKNTTLFLIIDTICPKIWAKIPLKNEKSPLPGWRASLKNVFALVPYSRLQPTSRGCFLRLLMKEK